MRIGSDTKPPPNPTHDPNAPAKAPVANPFNGKLETGGSGVEDGSDVVNFFAVALPCGTRLLSRSCRDMGSGGGCDNGALLGVKVLLLRRWRGLKGKTLPLDRVKVGHFLPATAKALIGDTYCLHQLD